ncbi:MAG: hypothetical protein J0M25_13660 [Flavobacteriales bacterium]|nr:hypothetical protein [Flavobacteriales bacterium]
MRKLIFIFVLLSGCTDKDKYEREEIKVFNDVLEEVLKKRDPSSLLPDKDEWEFDQLTGEIDSVSTLRYFDRQTKYFESFNHLLTINDTLKSLKEIIQKDHWLVEEPIYDSLTSNYLKLEIIENKRSLKNRIIDLRQIQNIWVYRQIGDTKNLDNRPISNINLELSRVSFDKEMKIGMFYCSVLDDSQTGYRTLILVRKNSDKWVMIHGTNYD